MVKDLIKKYKNLSLPVKAAIWFLICSILQKGISVLTTPVFTRLFTTEEYGKYSLYCSWSDILCIFITLNLSYGVYTQGLIKFENEKNIFTSALQGLTLFLSLVSFVIYLIGRKFFNSLFNLSTILMVCMFLSLWLNAVFGFWASEQQVNYRYKKLIMITFLVTILKPFLAIILILYLKTNKVEIRILSFTAIEIIFYSFLFISQIKKEKNIFNFKFWKYGLKYNVPLVPHYLSQTILHSSDRIMINRYCDTSSTGIYSLAYSLAMIMTIVNSSIINVLAPWIYRNIKEKNYKKIGENSYPVLIIIALVNLILVSLSPEIIYIFAPSSYYEAIWLIPPLAMSVYFMFLYNLFSSFAFYFEKTKMIMYGSIFGAILNIILNIFFIPKYGYMVAAYTTLFCYIIYAIGHYFFMRIINKKYMDNIVIFDKKIILTITFIFIILGFVLMLLYQKIIIRYIFVLLLFIYLIFKRKIIIEILKKRK